ncbi:MAG TPA: hypothetical protein VLM75_08850 [Spirochaetota bacterium]|nr:hypothetical protein [Spirochaetota bacterium]
MKSRKVLALLVAAVFAFAGAAFAQDAPKAEEPKPVVDVSGVLFLDYAYYVKSDSGQEKADNMRLTRAYLTFVKKFDDAWSARVTVDGAGLGTINEYAGKDNDADDQFDELTASEKANNIMFVKFAYVEMKQNFDPVELKIQYGIVGTPVISIIDSTHGARFIYNNYIDKSGDLLGKTGDTAGLKSHSLDVSSADMGVKADLSVMKMVTLTGMYSNGDGFRYTEDQKLTDKAYWGMISITPLKGLFINGYYHTRDIVAVGADDDEVTYYGGGLAWSDKSFKIGANYLIGERDSENVNQKADYTVYEIWANINLAEAVGVPVLLYGKYAVGATESDAATGGFIQDVDGTTYYAGLGYQFNKAVQAMVVYQAQKLEAKLVGGGKETARDNTLWVKTEVKF